LLALVIPAACTVAPQKGEPEKQTVTLLLAPVNSITAPELGDQFHAADAQVLNTLHMAAYAYPDTTKSRHSLPTCCSILTCCAVLLAPNSFLLVAKDVAHCHVRFRELYSSPDIQISNQFRQRMAECLGLTFQSPKV